MANESKSWTKTTEVCRKNSSPEATTKLPRFASWMGGPCRESWWGDSIDWGGLGRHRKFGCFEGNYEGKVQSLQALILFFQDVPCFFFRDMAEFGDWVVPKTLRSGVQVSQNLFWNVWNGDFQGKNLWFWVGQFWNILVRALCSTWLWVVLQSKLKLGPNSQ